MSLSRPQNLLSTPNLLSLSRIPLGAAFWFALGPTAEHSYWAFAVMGVAAVTDMLDGYLARRQAAAAAKESPGAGGPDDLPGDLPGGGTGAWLDPICDKIFVALVLASIVIRRHPPVPLVLLIVSRELLQLPLGLVYRFLPVLRSWLRYDFRASVLGKAATVAQFLAIATLILDHPSMKIFAAIAFLFGLAALADYVRRAIVIGRRRLAQAERRGRDA